QGVSYVAVGEPSAKKVLSWKIQSERLPANALVLAFDDVTNNSPYILSEILNDYYMRLREEGVDPYLPVIQPIEGSFKINTSVVLKGKKIGGELNSNDTRLLNELLNPNKTTLIMVGKGKNHYFLNAEHTGLKMTINTPKTGAPYVDVHIKIQGMIEESKKSVYERREIIEDEQQASITISSRVKTFLEHLQTLGVDPLGLGLNYQVKHGITDRDLQAWYAIYPNLEFHVKTDVKLKGTGTLY
ncbi:MAG TPA: Ger(x)C family spore germination C-terminal domain-containing protein, partial [Candidatus Angelobacter sp.]|nr:Ger(x)C family spore germination C-terminal domain-containing protein [Candidatus Angelobacter sp.]